MRRASLLIALALVVLLAGCGDDPQPAPTPPAASPEQGTEPPPAPAEPAEWVKPYDGWLPDTAPEHTAVVRVLDDRTGRPIPGATVRRHLEMEMGPDGWAPSYEEARTDEYGIAVIRIVQDRPWSAHWVVHAEGYGSDETYGVAPNEEVELLPGRDVHARILDAMGRPAVGIPIGYKLGCGHAPAVYDTTTDADGRFVLRGITNNGDVAYSGPGVLVDYYTGPLRRLDETPHALGAEPAVRIEGRIIGADPADLGARVVHSQSTTRGVAAHIHDDGTFVLDGVARESMLDLYWAPGEKGRRIDSGTYRVDVPLIWDVRKPADEEDEEESSEQEVEIPWRVLGPDGSDVQGGVSIYVYRTSDGSEAALDHDGASRGPLGLAPGTYDVIVGDPTARWVAPSTRFVVEAGKPKPLVVQATEQARLVLQWAEGKAPEGCTYGLAFARPDGRIDHEPTRVEEGEDGEEYAVYLPPTARASVCVRGDYVTRFFEVGPVADGRRIAVLAWPAPTVLRFEAPADVTVVSLGGFEHDFVREGRDCVVHTPLAGRLHLGISRWDDYGPLAAGARLVELPPPAGRIVRLDPLAYVADPVGQVTLLDASGAPRTNVDVEVSWFNPVTRELDSAEVATDAHGVATSPLFRTGARLVWNSDSRLDHGGVLEGTGPWIQRLSSTRVEITVRGPDGPLRDVAVLLADEVFQPDNQGFDDEADDGHFTFDAVPPGAQQIVISAPGHQAQQHRIVLQPGETRTIEVRLPLRP